MNAFVVLMLGALLAGAPAVAAPPAPTPTRIVQIEGISEYRLANGLRVLLYPDAAKPTVTTNMVYLVGSRHENYGETGMAHLLEHLLFKPTANFGIKPGTPTPVEVLNASGADFNGTTWYDRTNYHATFPADEGLLRTMLALEADRMVNAPIKQDDLWNAKAQAGEMTVVRNEFEMGESDPIAVTAERIQAVAFDWHNYGKSTIGARSDIEQVDIKRLRAFYKRWYQPDNAVLMVSGRFDQARVLAQVNALFGRIPKPKRVLPPTYTVEPVQDGERAVTVRRAGGTQFVGAGYHVPASSHPDAVALAVLGRILTDAPGGRLHKALVEPGLATRLQFDAVSNREPGYRLFGAVVPKDQPLDAAQARLVETIEHLRQAPVTEEELARAGRALRKEYRLAQTDPAGLTVALTESMAAGDWRLFFVQRDLLDTLNVKTVQAVAEKYFKPSNRTVGRFIPTDGPDRAEIPRTPDVDQLVQDYRGKGGQAEGERFDPSPANIEARLTRAQLDGGMRVALLPKKTRGARVALSLQLRIGSAAALQGRQDAGEFAARLLMHGTRSLSRQALADRLDELESELEIDGTLEEVTLSLSTTRAHLAEALALAADVLRHPAFAQDEFAQVQRERINQIEEDMPEPEKVAVNAFERLLDPTAPGHPHHVRTLPDQLAALRGLTAAQVRDFHARFYGAQDAVLAAVGDFDAQDLKRRLQALFGDWKAASPYQRIPEAVRQAKGERLVLNTPDKANSMLLAVQPLLLDERSPDYPALLMANHMLGGGALRSRLVDRIRQRDGLSYAVGSELEAPAREPQGYWLAYAISAPDNVNRVEQALREELARVLAKGFGAAELGAAKQGWRQAEEVSRSDDASLAARLAAYLALGRTMSWERDLQERIMKLGHQDITAAARRHLNPAALSIISAGALTSPPQ